jgi:Rrf2 family nitric oxide-sensitive transcriptional repressor
MQLLLYTDYALRILIFLGVHPDGPVPAGVIARAYGISGDHVAKAAKALTRLGLLRATRGARGGVRLARPPAEIRLAEVVRSFEAGRAPVACLREGEDPCPIEPACRLKTVLRRAQQAFYRELEGHTLAELVERPALRIRLSRTPAAGAGAAR